MKSEDFIVQLRHAMTEINLDEDIKEKHVNNFLILFAGKTDEEIDGIIESSGGIESILNGIVDLESKKHEYLLNDLENEAREIKKLNGTDIMTDDTVYESPASETKEIKVAKAKNEIPSQDGAKEKMTDATVTRPAIKNANNENPLEAEDEKPIRKTNPAAIKLAEKCAKFRRGMSETAFCISVPFICIGIALLFVLIVLLFPILCCLRFAVFILNFAVMTVGSILSGTGIIYGIVKFGSSPLVALYEIGLGIVFCGLTILLSVLLFGYLKKLSPFLKECAKELYFSFIMCVKAFFTLRVKEDRR